jgi:hypothetical protein
MKRLFLLMPIALGACAAAPLPATPSEPVAPQPPTEFAVKLPVAYWQFILNAMAGSDQKASDVRAASQEILKQLQAQQAASQPPAQSKK